MKTIFGIENLNRSFKKTVVTVGVFDGVHIGHRLVIKRVIREARRIKGKAVILTFDPHPLCVLNAKHKPPRLMSLAHKLRLFEDLGVDICIVIKFNKKFSKLNPQRFIKNILVDKLNVSKILVGKNFRFGESKKGTLPTLRKLSRKYNFSIESVEHTRMGKRIISSSWIRKLISTGELSAAAHLLGRPVSVLGTVIKGDERGRIIGCPTANIDPHHEVIPPSGVYAVKIKLQNRLFNGILNIGRCPTFKLDKDTEPTIEVHIFNFNRDLYRTDLEILFIKKIRDEMCFLNKEELIKQIRKDEKRAKKILNETTTYGTK